MTTEELAEATAEFDREDLKEKTVAPPPEELARLKRAMRKRGRPAKGNGSKVICITVEKGLLRRSDRMARKLGISRSALVARGLAEVLAPDAKPISRERPKKPYWEMTTEELAEATAEFDREFIGDTFRPLTPKERAEWERARRKPGRPQKSREAEVIPVPVEKQVLTRSDRLARRLGIGREALIARCIETGLDSTEKEGILK
jgi:hypothetical protein